MKLPYLQLYTGDWLKDPRLSMCSPSTRGIWVDLICAMHELGRCGQVTGTVDQLRRISRCTSAEMSAALAELDATKAADICNRNGIVTVINRRMQREYKERSDTNLRVQKHRANGKSPPVKRQSNKPSSISESHSKPSVANATGAHAPPDTVWTLGVRVMTAAGTGEQEARSFIGKLVKDFGKEAVAQAVATTSAQNPANPKEYIVKVLQGSPNGQPRAGPMSKGDVTVNSVRTVLAEIEAKKCRAN